MITTALGLLAFSTQRVPNNASFDYSGLPQLRTAEKVDVQAHSVTVNVGLIKEGYVDVSALTLYKNMTAGRIRATLIVPRRRLGDANSGQPGFDISATWNKAPLALVPASDHGYSEPAGNLVKYSSDLSAKVTLDAGATYSLRINYEVPIGKAGYEQKERVAGYLFDGDKTIDQLNITYKYNEKTVFDLPDMRPNMGWQVGYGGAFIRETNYWPDNQLTYMQFYPGGF